MDEQHGPRLIRCADNGWPRPWEAIYQRPWPLRERADREVVAACRDFCRDAATSPDESYGGGTPLRPSA